MSADAAPRSRVERVEILMARRGTRLEARHGRRDTGGAETTYWIVYPDRTEKQVSRMAGINEMLDIGQGSLF